MLSSHSLKCLFVIFVLSWLYIVSGMMKGWGLDESEGSAGSNYVFFSVVAYFLLGGDDYVIESIE
jgi:hypothetical protein